MRWSQAKRATDVILEIVRSESKYSPSIDDENPNLGRLTFYLSVEVPDRVTDEEGRLLQKRMWEHFAKILDSVEPGCVERVL